MTTPHAADRESRSSSPASVAPEGPAELRVDGLVERSLRLTPAELAGLLMSLDDQGR
jgi:hypothetical protein